MFRSGARRFRLSKTNGTRWIAGSPLRLALPVVKPTASSGGILSWLLGDKPASNVPPLYEPMPGVKLPPILPDYVKPAETVVSTLPNGLKIASEETAGPAVTVGLYVDSGSVYESSGYFGVSHLLERMAFKSTRNRSHFRLVREVEAIGGNVMASASREQMAYTGDAIKTYMPEIVELLVDTIRNPVFHSWEVKEQLSKVKAELGEIANNPESLLLEALHTAAYSGGLAQSLIASESSLANLNEELLHKFVTENYTAPRIVLAASGVDHKELLSVAEPLLSDMPNVPLAPPPKSAYVGGDWRSQVDSPRTHIALAFEAPGGWRNEKDAIALTVLQTLLGGGGSFSSGGPGKGMYSRFYLRVLNEHQEVHAFNAFSSIYNDTGLFGIHATSDSSFAPTLVDIACHELLAVAKPGSVNATELRRAKNSTISGVLMNLESRVVVTEDIGRQILTYGTRKPVQQFIEKVNALTLEDVRAIAEKVLSTPLTMASWGDIAHVHRYDEVAGRFRATK